MGSYNPLESFVILKWHASCSRSSCRRRSPFSFRLLFRFFRFFRRALATTTRLAGLLDVLFDDSDAFLDLPPETAPETMAFDSL